MTASIDVMHVKETYLKRSEKWFHYILELNSQDRKWLASRFLENLDEFPLGSIQLIPVAKQGVMNRIVNRCSMRLIDRPVFWGEAAYGAAIKSAGPQIVHAHYGPMGYVLSRDRSIDVPIVTSFYGYDISMLPRHPFWHASYRTLFERGAGFIVEGGQMKKALIELGCPPTKAFIVRVPVNPDSLPVKEYHAEKNGRRVILMCCNFVEKKGIPWALHAFAQVRKQGSDVELRIIGAGELWDNVVGLIRELDLTGAVTLLGAQPHSVFVSEAMQADIFMQPSIVARDGTTEGGAPTVLLEAQCMGLPVVSSFHADIPEVVWDGESGHLVPERDVESLSNALAQLLDAPGRWPEMGRTGREHVLRQHAPKAVGAQLHAVYDSVLQDQKELRRPVA